MNKQKLTKKNKLVKKQPIKKQSAKKKPKYKNKKAQVDGILFDSRAEARYYILHRNNKNMKMQVKFLLTDTMCFEHNGQKKTIGKMSYIPDFVFYDDNGNIEKVVDVKGMKTKEFNVKAKIFMEKYQIPIILAKYDSKTGMFIEEIA